MEPSNPGELSRLSAEIAALAPQTPPLGWPGILALCESTAADAPGQFSELISKLKETFKSTSSQFRRRYDFLQTSFTGGALEEYTGISLRRFTTSRWKEMTRRSTLQLLESKTEITLLELETKIKRLLEIRDDSQRVGTSKVKPEINAIKAKKAAVRMSKMWWKSLKKKKISVVAVVQTMPPKRRIYLNIPINGTDSEKDYQSEFEEDFYTDRKNKAILDDTMKYDERMASWAKLSDKVDLSRTDFLLSTTPIKKSDFEIFRLRYFDSGKWIAI
ncbi:unnamed protein product [Caenorhabditis sp. 36 PRJEB53466]|nr:unnamed protein product [Caenorhabditis sp. 36 PRJEB53466]